jgi:LCP family protein required for cell wall assembly
MSVHLKNEKFKAFWLNNKKRNLKILIVAIAILFAVFAVMTGNRIYNLLQQVNPDDGIDFKNADETYVDNYSDFEAIHDIGDASSIDDLLYQWATNGGDKISSKNVVNVMLFGVDTKNGLMDSGRTDAMLLVSLNRKTKVISIVSFMRDSYTYMDIDGQKRFFKINAAYGWGGPATVLKTIEDNYKIAIDNYVCVDFSTFPKIIDSLGGITVEVQPYEARCIKESYGVIVGTGEEVLLDGKSALMFSRIRKCDVDGDISRTRRQRAVIMAIIDRAGDAKTGQLNSALDFIFPNIRTNYNKSDILTLGTQALIQKWADYDVYQITSPGELNRTSATIKTHYVWVIDYPVEARGVQLALYGVTNIVLDDDRVSALKLLPPTTTSRPKPSTTGSGETTAETQPGNLYSTTVAVTQEETATVAETTTSVSVETSAD